MYGFQNYILKFETDFLKIKIVFWSNVVWENRNIPPDFSWLENNLKNAETYDHQIVVCHIPPFSDQFLDQNLEENYINIMRNYKIPLSIHGHNHNYEYHHSPKPYYENLDTEILVIGSTQKNSYCNLYISKEECKISQIYF